MFYNLLLDKNVPITVHFDDVSDNIWYSTAVNTLASLGILTGYDGKFEPERAVTRAEVTAIAMRFARLPEAGENIFSDVSGDVWYYDYVIGSVQYGWITGYPDGTFCPESTITRAEVTAIVNRMLNRSADGDYVDSHAAELIQFSDLSGAHWAYYDIMEAVNAHDYRRDEGEESWTGVQK